MARTLYAVREPKMVLSAEFVTKALELHPIAIGFASSQGDEVQCKVIPGDELDLKDALRALEEAYKDHRVHYHFIGGNPEEAFKSLQPFKLLTNGEEGDQEVVTLAAMIDAELPQFSSEQVEEGETNELRFVHSFLIPKIMELWDLAGGNDDQVDAPTAMKQLLTFLERKPFKEAIMPYLAPRGTVVLITPEKAIPFADNDAAVEWTWGMSTKSIGLTSDKAPAVSAVPAKPTMRQLAALAAKPKAEDTPAVVQPDKKKEFVPAKPAPDTGSPITPEEQFAKALKHAHFKLNGKTLMCIPPKESWKADKTWWNRNSTLDIPSDPKVFYMGFPFDKLKPDAPLRAAYNKLMNIEPKTAESEQGPAVPARTEPEPKQESAKMTLHIPANQREAFIGLKKAGRLTRVDDAALIATLAEYPSATLQLGENGMDDILHMDPFAYLRLSQHTLACLFHELRCDKLGLKKPDAAKAETEVHVLAKEELKPTAANSGKPQIKMSNLLKKTG